MLTIGRVSDRKHIISVSTERLSNDITSIGVPDPNGLVIGSGDDVQSIRRVRNGANPVSVTC